MKGVTSIAELRKRMRLTGAEVLPKKIHKCEDLILISDRQHQGWSEQLHLGGPLRHRRRCQVRSATSDYLWYLSISTFYQGARHHLLDLPRRGRRHGVLEGAEIISIFAEEASTCYQVGESDQRFVVLKRSGSHYTLLCTQVIFFQKPDSDYQYFRRMQSLAWRSFVRPSTSSSGGLRLTRRARYIDSTKLNRVDTSNWAKTRQH